MIKFLQTFKTHRILGTIPLRIREGEDTYPYSELSYTHSEASLVHLFCDASKDAIGAVAYLQLFGPNSAKTTFSFLLGKGKLASNGSNTIPRMELCAADLGAEIARSS